MVPGSGGERGATSIGPKEQIVILVITYDLHNPGRDYDSVAEAIKEHSGSWAHPQGSVWFVDTQFDPAKWRDLLHAAGDDNDEYFVCQLRQYWASRNMDTDVTDWLKSPYRNW